MGPQHGLRLHARIQQQKTQIEAARKGHTDASLPPLHAHSSSSFSSSSPSRYGECSVRSCGHPGVAVCSSPACGAAVCVWHEAKSLLTGHVYCPHCEADTWEGKVRAAYVTAASTADAATAQLIDRTAEWTAQGREALTGEAPHPLHSPPAPHSAQADGSHRYQYSGEAGQEEKQRPLSPFQQSSGGGGAAAPFTGRPPFVSDWLRGDEDGEELSEGHYREQSWNSGQAQCSLQ